MKLAIIEKALSELQHSGKWTEDELVDIQNCWVELAEMKRAEPDSYNLQDVYVIPVQHMIDYGNRMWYDTYGRMARRIPNGRDVPANFINAIRDECYIETASSLLLEDIHSFLNDLWHDNEEQGENDTDGTYKMQLTQEDLEFISNLVHDKLDELQQGDMYEHWLQLSKRLRQERDYRKTGHFTTAYCGAESCNGCDGSACRP